MKHPFYVLEQGAKLRTRNRRLVVDKDAEFIQKTPLSHISEVVIYGNVGITTPAISVLLQRGVDVVFLRRDGKYRGRLIGEMTPHVPVRQSQYKALDCNDFVLDMAKGFVEAKLRHQRALLQRHNRTRGDDDIADCIDQLKAWIDAVPRKTKHSSLLGLEGSASATYFRGFRRLLNPPWQFERRNRRPPRDPINHPIRSVRLPLRQCMVEQARQVVKAVQQQRPRYRPMGFR